MTSTGQSEYSLLNPTVKKLQKKLIKISVNLLNSVYQRALDILRGNKEKRDKLVLLLL